MTIPQFYDILIAKEPITVAESIMLDKAKDFAVNIVNLCRMLIASINTAKTKQL